MVRSAVRKSVAAACLIVGLALVAPPPAAAAPWFDLGLVAKVTQALGTWWGTYTNAARIGDDTASLDPDGRH